MRAKAITKRTSASIVTDTDRKTRLHRLCKKCTKFDKKKDECSGVHALIYRDSFKSGVYHCTEFESKALSKAVDKKLPKLLPFCKVVKRRGYANWQVRTSMGGYVISDDHINPKAAKNIADKLNTAAEGWHLARNGESGSGIGMFIAGMLAPVILGRAVATMKTKMDLDIFDLDKHNKDKMAGVPIPSVDCVAREGRGELMPRRKS